MPALSWIIVGFFGVTGIAGFAIEKLYRYLPLGRPKSITQLLVEAQARYGLLRLAAFAENEDDLLNLDKRQNDLFERIRSLPHGPERAALDQILLENMADVIYAKNRVRRTSLTPSQERIITRSHMPPTKLYRYVR